VNNRKKKASGWFFLVRFDGIWQFVWKKLGNLNLSTGDLYLPLRWPARRGLQRGVGWRTGGNSRLHELRAFAFNRRCSSAIPRKNADWSRPIRKTVRIGLAMFTCMTLRGWRCLPRCSAGRPPRHATTPRSPDLVRKGRREARSISERGPPGPRRMGRGRISARKSPEGTPGAFSSAFPSTNGGRGRPPSVGPPAPIQRPNTFRTGSRQEGEGFGKLDAFSYERPVTVSAHNLLSQLV